MYKCYEILFCHRAVNGICEFIEKQQWFVVENNFWRGLICSRYTFPKREFINNFEKMR